MTRRAITALVLAVVLPLFGYLLYQQLSRYSVDEVMASIAAIPRASLLLAGGFAAASYLCLTGFDYLAVRYAGHRLPWRQVAPASFVSLSIGHNIGIAAMSSGAIRYRFYSRLGLGLGDVAKVILFCGLTVGLGLVVLGGVALLLNPALAGSILGLERTAVLLLGGGCLALAALYLALAALLRRPLRLRRWELEMPRLPLALSQVILGPLNFACVAACLHSVLAAQAEIGYAGTATAYALGNGMALVSHVPGGLGVLESVVLYLLPETNALGALLVFRCVYFLAPLSLGAPLFALIELAQLGRRRAAAANGA